MYWACKLGHFVNRGTVNGCFTVFNCRPVCMQYTHSILEFQNTDHKH